MTLTSMLNGSFYMITKILDVLQYNWTIQQQGDYYKVKPVIFQQLFHNPF